uniref:ATP-binding protein n=1 Tax=Paraburkholderia podalyriae TaxID=1938811 RepID=UPI001655F0D6|nr:ATP-binding protein [Paraburkholderia podalyriae]
MRLATIGCFALTTARFRTILVNQSPEPAVPRAIPVQRIIKVRRDYNTWVADETIEDYALRFTPRTFRKWSEFRVANTAFGAISFLALEAVGGSITVSFGFTNALWAIVLVGAIIFLTSLPISYYAAKFGVDMDLLTRGAGFGYIGSTVTSLIYASFTFIFFALEATIMAMALQLYFGIPLSLSYLICAVIVIPLVTHGITLISRLQAFTQPLWLVLLMLPYAAVIWKEPGLLRELPNFVGNAGGHGHFDLLMFGTATTVLTSMIAQVGEQVDFLRFLPERTSLNKRRWTLSMLSAGPGWIVLGVAKLLGGSFLAVLAIQHGVLPDRAVEPTQMYLVAYKYLFGSPECALLVTTFFIVLSQLKINVTNAYAGSLAWSNFFARLTHSHPGRVVWLVFNVLIAFMLMELGVFRALEQVLGLYANIAISWVGAVVADLVINKPLGLSPKGIEFKRAHLYDVNPVGVGATLIASTLSVLAFTHVLGETAHAFSALIALTTALIAAPAIAWATSGKYYIARQPVALAGVPLGKGYQSIRCCICDKAYETEDMAHCPAYEGSICSLCCTVDARCHDLCKPGARLSEQTNATIRWLLPKALSTRFNTRIGQYLLLFVLVTMIMAAILGLIYTQESVLVDQLSPAVDVLLRTAFLKLFAVLALAGGIGCWWSVLTSESRRVAQEESNRQTHLLLEEIDAHQRTDAQLQRAKQTAEKANLAKSRYVTGISHELRTPLNSILGYAQMLEQDTSIPPHHHLALAVIRRSGEHLVSLIDGLLDIAKIETGKMTLEFEEVRFPEFVSQLADMVSLQASAKGIAFHYEAPPNLPCAVRADKKRVGQILINVLGNAVKFTDRGNVTLRLQYRREMAVFEIIDSGMGIDADDLTRIFLPFQRGGNVPGGSENGTGLGLTIARMLADVMGGTLTVDSETGRGSTFRVQLFLPEVREPQPVQALPKLPIGGYAGPTRRVLVVDNERVDRELHVKLLEPLGFEVQEASSGLEALKAVSSFAPDLILLDIGMPLLDGWETARLFRANLMSNAPIIVVSANAFDKGRKNAAGIRNEDFLVKPVNVVELLELIRERLDLRWVPATPVIAAQTPSVDPSLAAAPSTLPAKAALPGPELLRSLHELGSLGYVRGILDKLGEIDQLDPSCGVFTGVLRSHVERFDLAEYLRHLDRTLQANSDATPRSASRCRSDC